MENNRKPYIALNILIVLSFVIALIFLYAAPPVIPAHYNFRGEIDRYGSKFEFLLFPLITIITGIFFRIYAKSEGKKESGSNEKIILISGIITVLVFTLLEIIFMFKAVSFDGTPAVSGNSDFAKIIASVSGVIFILMGALLPNVRRNSLIGLRTSWSMANDEVWKESQKAGGMYSVIAGFIILISSVFLNESKALTFMMIIIILFVAASVAASYRIYRKYMKDHT